MFFQPGEPFFHQRRPPALVGGELVPLLAAGDVPAQSRVAGEAAGEVGEAGVGVADGVQAGQDVDARLLQVGLLFGGGVEEPAVAEVVRHDVGGDLAVDAAHHEVRRADHAGVGFAPPQDRDRDVAVGRHPLDGAVLAGQVIVGENGNVRQVRGHPGDQPFGAGVAGLVPGHVEQQGLAGHAGGGGAAQFADGVVGALRQVGGDCWQQRGAHLVEVAAGAMQLGRIRSTCRFGALCDHLSTPRRTLGPPGPYRRAGRSTKI